MPDRPVVRLDLPRSTFTSAEGALSCEWLVTNGLGGFAAGTVAQANTRRYHGLLVASLRPPVERVVMVSKADTTAHYRGRSYALGCNEFADGTLSPRGFELLVSFSLEDGLPVWTYSFADVVLEQRLWMAERRNTTYLALTVLSASAPVDIELVPLCTYRDYHSHTTGGWPLHVVPEAQGCKIVAFNQARAYRLLLEPGEFVAGADWYWHFRHRVEAERGLDVTEDLFRPGLLRTPLAPGATATLICTAELDVSGPRKISRPTVPDDTPAWIQQLVLAADQFIVARQGVPDGTTIIAGYPWFSDWGRDTMIALPGLTLSTGRFDDAAAILRTFAQHASRGMLPNRFPDGGEPPEYNTADAALWYFHAVDAYLQATNDRALLRDIYPVLQETVAWYQRGTRYGIQVDPADGLLRVGEQLTWMDARIGNFAVTPRTGKPVEINALWHYALTCMSRWAALHGDGNDYGKQARRVAAVFSDTFWFSTGNYLYDVVDGPDGVDSTLRPNQIFAVSLGTDLLDAKRSRAVVDVCARDLVTPLGLRSLAPQDARYAGVYAGGPPQRDSIYHQGPVWPWLLGPFALAHFRVYKNALYARRLLEGIAAHLTEGCMGTVSEIMDGSAPHTPRGCFAQAWSVAETLRAWRALGSLSDQ